MLDAVKPARRRATYEDVLAAPEHMVAEIVDGELFTSPRPAPRHAAASSWLGAIVAGAFHGPAGIGGAPGGWWIIDEPELHLGPDIVVPDVVGWRRERMPQLPDDVYFQLAPDWVCEVASPSTVTLDRGRKMRVYAREGVAHLWLVDPLAKTLEVYRLTGERGQRAWLLEVTHVGTEVVRAAPFDAIEIDLARCWADTG